MCLDTFGWIHLDLDVLDVLWKHLDVHYVALRYSDQLGVDAGELAADKRLSRLFADVYLKAQNTNIGRISEDKNYMIPRTPSYGKISLRSATLLDM